MKKSSKNTDEKNKNVNSDNNIKLSYFKINKSSRMEELGDEIDQILLMSVNSISVDGGDNIGKELNKFFDKILPENNNDILKTNFDLSKTIRNLTKLKKTEKIKQHEEYMTYLMNLKIDQNFVLNKDNNEKLGFVISMIFKKIRKEKKKKFNNLEELYNYIDETSLNYFSILEKYYNSKENIRDDVIHSFIYTDYSKNQNNDLFIDDSNNKTIMFSNYNANSRVSRLTNFNKNEFNKSVYVDYISNLYKFKELKRGKKDALIPFEIFILREKFAQVKKLKLILKRNYNINDQSSLIIGSRDIQYNILILLNLKWLFPHLFEMELDLTNEYILRDLVLENEDKYRKFLKKSKRNKKSTYYQSESKKRVFDLYKKSIFSEQEKTNFEDYTSDFGSFSIISSFKDDDVHKQEQFLNRYMNSLEMIIIYWYFVSKIDSLKNLYYTIPISLEDKITSMLKEKKIYLFEFNIFSSLSPVNILDITIDFNSLDNKLFQQVLSFLYKSSKMTNCRLSFFPPEEYFDPKFLLSLLLKTDQTKGIHYLDSFRTSEEVDIFLLRKLSDYFQTNISKFFCFFVNNPNIKELSLIFDIPTILKQVDYYEIIIMKLILNIFIHLNICIPKDSHNALSSLAIFADNLILDNRKHPYLNECLDSITIYRKNTTLKKLTLKIKMYEIGNIYKIIPYKINYLTLGYFDLETLKYFVEYITSSEFGRYSEIKNLQVFLGNTIISLDTCYDLVVRLLTEYPKHVQEIDLYTSLNVSLCQITDILCKTNYNTVEKIFIQFNKASLENDDFKKKYGKANQLKENKDDKFINLFYVKRNEKDKKKILNTMYRIGNKYNKLFMDYNIFLCLEKLISGNDKKKIIVQYK